MARYEASRGVIGFRLHAALLGLGLGKPVIPVGLDWRGLGIIRSFGLEEFSIRPYRFGQFRRLRQLTGRLLSNEERLIGGSIGPRPASELASTVSWPRRPVVFTART